MAYRLPEVDQNVVFEAAIEIRRKRESKNPENEDRNHVNRKVLDLVVSRR